VAGQRLWFSAQLLSETLPRAVVVAIKSTAAVAVVGVFSFLGAAVVVVAAVVRRRR